MQSSELVILAKKETTYGTDVTPTGVANAILTRDFSLSPIEADKVERNLDRPGLGASPALIAGKSMSCSFKVEAVGSGSAGVATKAADIFKACALAETIVATTSVAYAPVSSSFDSASLYAHLEGRLHKLLGWRGAMGFELQAGQVPYFVFDGKALYGAPTDVSLPTADFSSFKDPLVAENGTTTWSLNAISAVLISATINKPGNLKFRNMPGTEQVSYSGKRNMTGSVECFIPSVATFDPFSLMAANTLVPFQLIHGTVAGKKVQIDAPKAQITGVSYGDKDGEKTYKIDFTLTATDQGDDEIKYTFN